MYITVLTDLPLHVPLLEAVLHPLQALLLSLLRVLHGVLVYADCHESREVNVIVHADCHESREVNVIVHFASVSTIQIIVHLIELSICLNV